MGLVSPGTPKWRGPAVSNEGAGSRTRNSRGSLPSPKCPLRTTECEVGAGNCPQSPVVTGSKAVTTAKRVRESECQAGCEREGCECV